MGDHLSPGSCGDSADPKPEWVLVFEALRDEAVWLHAKWLEYRKLYAHSPERIELLNGTAGFFFRVVQDVLWDDVVLGLARLTDREATLGKPNLTLKRLPSGISDEQLRVEVQHLVDVAVERCEVLWSWRNKRLAHNDLAVALETGAELLAGISRQEIEDAFSAVEAVLSRMELERSGAEIGFRHFWAISDAEQLVFYLDTAVQAEVQRRDHLARGCPMPEDLGMPGGGARRDDNGAPRQRMDEEQAGEA